MKARGFALAELMIALVLGLVLFAGVGHLVLSSSRSWALQDEQARIQENARLALDILTQSISTAAYTGCPVQTKLANLLYTENNMRLWMMHFDKGILGIPSTSVKQSWIQTPFLRRLFSIALMVPKKSLSALIIPARQLSPSPPVTLTTKATFGVDRIRLRAGISVSCRRRYRNTVVTHPEASAGSLTTA